MRLGLQLSVAADEAIVAEERRCHNMVGVGKCADPIEERNINWIEEKCEGYKYRRRQ